MARIAILGSNFGALAAAARLKVKGHDVTILEESSEFALSVIAHTNQLTLPAAFRDLFLKTGDALENHIDLHEVDIAYSVSIADRDIRIPGFGIASVSSAIHSALGSTLGNEWDTHVQAQAKTWAKLHPTFENYEKFLESAERLFAPKFWQPKTKKLRNSALIEIRNANPLRVSHSPAEFISNLLPYVQATFGTYQVAGGMQSLAAALIQRCSELEVNLQSNATISACDAGNQQLTVTVGNKTLEFDYLIVDSELGVSGQLLKQFATPTLVSLFDMQTTHPRIFTVGAITLPGPGMSFEVLSGSMLANLIGSV